MRGAELNDRSVSHGGVGEVSGEHAAERADHFEPIVLTLLRLPAELNRDPAIALDDWYSLAARPFAVLHQGSGDLLLGGVRDLILPAVNRDTPDHNHDLAILANRAGAVRIHGHPQP